MAQLVFFTGTMDSGKSTLAQLVLGLRQPTVGTITVDGTDLRVQGLKIKRLHEGPDGAGLVADGQQSVKITGTQFDLVAHRALHARRALGLAPLQDSRTVRRNRQALEQGTRVPVRSRFVRDLVHAQSYAAFVPTNVHRL